MQLENTALLTGEGESEILIEMNNINMHPILLRRSGSRRARSLPGSLILLGSLDSMDVLQPQQRVLQQVDQRVHQRPHKVREDLCLSTARCLLRQLGQAHQARCRAQTRALGQAASSAHQTLGQTEKGAHQTLGASSFSPRNNKKSNSTTRPWGDDCSQLNLSISFCYVL